MDIENKKALKAATYYTISNFISKAIFYIFTPLFIRILTVDEYGMYNNFISWQSILVVLFTLELNSSINNAYLDYDDDKIFNSFITTISIFSIIISFFLSLIIIINSSIFTEIFDLEFSYLIILLIYLCFSSTFQIFQTEQIAKVKYKLTSLIVFFSSSGMVVITLVLLYFMENKLTAILIGNTIFTMFISCILLVYIVYRNSNIKKEYLMYAFTISIPLIPHILSTTILGTAGKIMINKYCGSDKTALFSLVYIISMIIMLIISSVNKAWIPWFFSKLKNNNINDIKDAITKILPMISFLSFGLCIIAPEIVFLVGGKNYESSYVLMPPIILHCYCNYIYTLYVNIEFYNKKTFGISIATVLTAIVNIFLNYICVIEFGYISVAYVTFFSSVILLILHIYNVKCQNMLFIMNNKFIVKNFVVTVILCLCVIWMYKYTFLRIVSIIVYLFIFIIILKKYKIRSLI